MVHGSGAHTQVHGRVDRRNCDCRHDCQGEGRNIKAVRRPSTWEEKGRVFANILWVDRCNCGHRPDFRELADGIRNSDSTEKMGGDQIHSRAVIAFVIVREGATMEIAVIPNNCDGRPPCAAARNKMWKRGADGQTAFSMHTIHDAERAFQQNRQSEGRLRRYSIAILQELCAKRGIQVDKKGSRPLKKPYLDALLAHVRRRPSFLSPPVHRR